jgi:hypothetical protein
MEKQIDLLQSTLDMAKEATGRSSWVTVDQYPTRFSVGKPHTHFESTSTKKRFAHGFGRLHASR